MLTLWDLLKPAVARVITIARPPTPTPTPTPTPHPTPSRARKSGVASKIGRTTKRAKPQPSGEAEPSLAMREAKRKPGMQEKYDAVVALMLEKYGVRVRKWRSSSSGVAWTVTYRDGRVVRLLESPKPKGPMSMAIFLHEIGHHAIGLGVYRPRCLEEYHAWAFSLRAMEEHGLNITDSVRNRMQRSLRYAVRKARRRGLRELPAELLPYI